VTAVGSQGALVSAFLAKHYGGHEGPGTSVQRPVDTITARDHHHLVTSNIVKLRHHSDGQDLREPLHTIAAGGQHFGEVRAFLMKYYSPNDRSDPRLTAPLHTIRTKDCFGLVTVKGSQYAIVDIGMRMLTPRELYRAQGFRGDYVIDPQFNGKPMTKEAQVRMCGNSVPPPVARALVEANLFTNQVRAAA
jgi:DNA (cytosine-5)-methyltransferase 1